MKSLVYQLCRYGACRRDSRSILTHFIGSPMVVVAKAGFALELRDELRGAIEARLGPLRQSSVTA